MASEKLHVEDARLSVAEGVFRPFDLTRAREVVRRLAISAPLAAAVLLRIAAVFRYRIDSDEPQHLHVVWGWTHGLLQYRDVFDNHMPLFQMLCAPLLGVIGERPQALIAMRVAMLPLYLAAIALTWRIASACYSRRVALWSTIIAALCPLFLLGSTEFRTDDLWVVFWLLAVSILVRPPLNGVRVFSAGLALGAAAAVSAKTMLLLFALAVGALIALLDTRSWRHMALAPLFLVRRRDSSGRDCDVLHLARCVAAVRLWRHHPQCDASLQDRPPDRVSPSSCARRPGRPKGEGTACEVPVRDHAFLRRRALLPVAPRRA